MLARCTLHSTTGAFPGGDSIHLRHHCTSYNKNRNTHIIHIQTLVIHYLLPTKQIHYEIIMRQNIFLFLVMSGSSLFFCSSLSFHLPKRRKGGHLSNRIQDVTTMTTSNDLSQLEFIQDVGINQEDASSSIRVSKVGRRERFVTCVRKTLKKHRMNVALAVSFSSMVSCRTAFAIESPNVSYSNKASIPAVRRTVKSVATNNKMVASKTQDNRDSLTKSISTKVIVPSVPVMISAGAGYSYILKKTRKQNNVEFIAIEDLETERKAFVEEVDTIIENATHIGNNNRGENNSVNGLYQSKMNTNVNGDTNDAVYTTTCVDPKSTRPNESCDDITNTISYEPKANNEIRNDVTDSYVKKVSELSSSIIDESGSTIIDDPIDSHFEDPQHLSENQKIEDNPTSICSNTSPIPLLLDDDDDETVKETAWFEQALSSPEGESIRKLFENGM